MSHLTLHFLVILLLANCSGSNFSSNSSKGGSSLASSNSGKTTVNQSGTSATDSGNKDGNDNQAKLKKAAPPEDVTGAYLAGGYLACEVFNTGAGDNASMAQVGCNAFKADHTPMDLSILSPSWNITSMSGGAIASTELVMNKYNKAWKISYLSVYNGFTASMSALTTDGSKTIVQNHAYDSIVQYLPDGRIFSAFATLPNNGILNVSPLLGSSVRVSIPQAPFALSNYSVSAVLLDPSTGYCSTTLANVSLSDAAHAGAFEILNMSTTANLNGPNGTYFCLKINTTVNVNGALQTISLYQR